MSRNPMERRKETSVLPDEQISIVEKIQLSTLRMHKTIIDFITTHVQIGDRWMVSQELIDHF